MKLNTYKSITVQTGFTLLELMIALTLGLIVSAIAIQLTFTAQKGVSTQQALSNLQSDALFGLEAVVRDTRLANLNASDVVVNDIVLHGGVVLHARNYSSKKDTNGNIQIELVNALSRGNVSNTSNLVGVNSDELVIQYRNMMEGQYDCEGRRIPIDTYVVQKYFIRKDDARDDPNEPYALACIAAFYTGDEPAKIDLSGKGEIIVPRVDHFRVLLGVATDKCTATDLNDGVMSCFGYIPIETYKNLTAKPQIVALKMGLLVRSLNTLGSNNLFDKNKVYTILNDSAKLKEDIKNQKYMRSVVSQTIALRNGFGIEKQS
jgi:type IV pilus assembly protein PilW